ncbi:MAG: hypothetical protein CMI18_06560 [Opitutaceae bacterium]|nr:hypothetical protein [Opitutaceae bacterium]
MRFAIQKLSFCLLFGGLVVWLIGGAKKGFYVSTEERPQSDPVTEIEYTETHSKFLPGIESLAIGVLLGGSFYFGSFLFSKSSQNSHAHE